MKKTIVRGFTLIELMIVVAIIGILAVLAIFGVRKYLANSKTAEARNNIGMLAKSLGAAFDRENSAGANPGEGNTVAIIHNLCLKPSAPVPANVPAAQKYQSKKAEWDVDNGTPNKGFACAKFAIDDPQYYQYNFNNTGTGTTDGDNNLITVNGDLNGDGVLSTFTFATTVKNGRLMPDTNITESNPEE